MVSITIDRGDRGVASYRSRRRETKKPETRTLRDGERSFREKALERRGYPKRENEDHDSYFLQRREKYLENTLLVGNEAIL